jgi:hypothetical protein
MSKHTPSPWVIDAERGLIHATDDRHTVVCHIGNLMNPAIAADARLIAAAPELLDALRRLVDATWASNVAALMDVARAAIGKAERAA